MRTVLNSRHRLTTGGGVKCRMRLSLPVQAHPAEAVGIHHDVY